MIKFASAVLFLAFSYNIFAFTIIDQMVDDYGDTYLYMIACDDGKETDVAYAGGDYYFDGISYSTIEAAASSACGE